MKEYSFSINREVIQRMSCSKRSHTHQILFNYLTHAPFGFITLNSDLFARRSLAIETDYCWIVHQWVPYSFPNSKLKHNIPPRDFISQVYFHISCVLEGSLLSSLPIMVPSRDLSILLATLVLLASSSEAFAAEVSTSFGRRSLLNPLLKVTDTGERLAMRPLPSYRALWHLSCTCPPCRLCFRLK